MSISEIGHGDQLDEAKFKRLTDGDKMKARKMYQDFFEFLPTHKFWMSTNHKPHIHETVEAVWRRIFLIPFSVSIPNQDVDKALAAKLQAEAAGIMAWMVRGCLAWQADGLRPPESIINATSSYRDEMDVIGQYIKVRCIADRYAVIGASHLYEYFKDWCESEGIRPYSQKRFGTYVKALDWITCSRDKTGKTVYEKIRLRSPADPAITPTSQNTMTGAAPVTPQEFFKEKCCYQTSEPFDLETDAKEIYEAYFEFCRELSRPEVAMEVLDQFIESLGYYKIKFEENPAFFRGIGL